MARPSSYSFGAQGGDQERRDQQRHGGAGEIQIGLEPPARDPGPAPTTDQVTFTAPTGAAKAVVGGGSFNDAAMLDGPGSYADTVQPGEAAFQADDLNQRNIAEFRANHGRVGGSFAGAPLLLLHTIGAQRTPRHTDNGTASSPLPSNWI